MLVVGFGLIDPCCGVQLKLFRNVIALSFWLWKVGVGLAYGLPGLYSRLAQCFVEVPSFLEICFVFCSYFFGYVKLTRDAFGNGVCKLN